MNDPEKILKLLQALKGWSIAGDILLGVLVCASILVIYHWQKHQITALKEYISLWNPSRIKQDVEAYIGLKGQLNEATLEQLRSDISRAKDKESEAMRIITDLQERNSRMAEKLAKYEKPDLSDIIPKDAELSPSQEANYVIWTVKFRNELIKRFKFPIKKE